MMTIGFQTPEVDETQIRRTRLELQKSPTRGSKSPMGLEPVQTNWAGRELVRRIIAPNTHYPYGKIDPAMPEIVSRWC